ncbi:hypothetical protein [Zhihengliuella sp.]|uniref:hypothetical protein n=1 Tax=Zhihengliuella sp. TaxID=1954483 RepID=UPI002811B737|nr:hypothetical protein [Zhihengliuella sp.]
MYAWFFRTLPGPFWLRVLISVALLAGVILVLFVYVFPWVSGRVSLWTDSTIGWVLL